MSDRILRRERLPRAEANGVVPKTRGNREAEIAEAVVEHHRTRYGRGPEAARAHLVDDLVLVRQRGTLTPAEARLARTGEGWDLVKQMRRKLAEVTGDELSELIHESTGRRVLEHFTDISRAGDRVDVFILERSWEGEHPN
jgi:uncharacterized protein YbcI